MLFKFLKYCNRHLFYNFFTKHCKSYAVVYEKNYKKNSYIFYSYFVTYLLLNKYTQGLARIYFLAQNDRVNLRVQWNVSYW